MRTVPSLRIRPANKAGVNTRGDYVVYWMTAFRRTQWNFSLQRAVHWAQELNKPLVVFEPLGVGYRWASDRLHKFVIEGMADNARRLASRDAAYYPYVEPDSGAGQGLLAALAERAAVVVGDDYPAFFLPRMVQAAARKLSVLLELVDSNGLLPLRAADRAFSRAFDFRRFLQKELRPYLKEFPAVDPLRNAGLQKTDDALNNVQRKWPAADVVGLSTASDALASFPIDHDVQPAEVTGGGYAGVRLWRTFLRDKLSHYAADRNEPSKDAVSGLSPYLHFGHISAHQVFAEAVRRDDWTIDALAKKSTGSKSGWWGCSEDVEAFLDELVTWRELGFNMCVLRDDYDQYNSLPDWARKTLADHAGDPRKHCYELEEFEKAATHDELWNAAQRQLLREGRIHGYLRMLWGKKILEWSANPRDALRVMIELNNKYALDGRDPNSYSGIFWVLGRYDRAWGPERPIFGKIRYMSSENTARKFDLDGYLARYGVEDGSS